MPAGDLITGDFQVEYRGVLVGGDTDHEVVSIDGLGLPDLRTGDIDRPLDHGQFAGEDYLSGRSFVMEIEVWGSDDLTFRERVGQVMTATTPSNVEEELVFRLPRWGGSGSSEDRAFIKARPRRRAGPRIDVQYALRVAVIAVEFWATDPRIYSYTEGGGTVSIEAASGGLGFPATFDLSFGGIGTSNTINVTNLGNFETRPTVRLDGPLVNPSIENVTTGQQLRLLGTLASGEWLDVDFLNRTVLLNGTASRYNWVADPAGWFVLPPGLSTVRFIGSGAGTLSLEYRSAWV